MKLLPRFGDHSGAMSITIKGYAKDKQSIEVDWQLLDLEGGALAAVAPA
jgi:hypothetical protein